MTDDLTQEAPVPVTAGFLLRLAREANGLHIAALAVSIRVPVKKLEALEANRLDELHDPVFIRALAGLVCRALKIEPAPVMDLLPNQRHRSCAAMWRISMCLSSALEKRSPAVSCARYPSLRSCWWRSCWWRLACCF